MDWCQNQVSVAENLHSNCSKLDEVPEIDSKLASLDDLFASHGSEGDMALEWLSTFVEDCLTSTANCLPPSQVHPKNVQTNCSTKAADKNSEQVSHSREKVKKTTSFLHRIVIPAKARSKRKRASFLKARTPFSCWSYQDQSFQLISSDPPLLQQAYWLADSELIKTGTDDQNIKIAKKQEQRVEETAPLGLKEVADGRERLRSLDASSNGLQQPRRCSHCLAQKTPQWRTGPLGPKTLCNACGVRYKSGRLLPEYRPAKSPTFVSNKHSNSHKKVMEMRMALLESTS